MQFLKKFAKTDIYNITALFKTTNKMYKIVNKIDYMQSLCIYQREECFTDIKMFVQIAKGKYKNVAIFFVLSRKDTKERKKL